MDKIYALDSAITVLPLDIRQSIAKLPCELRDKIEELRLRVGKPLSVTIDGKEREVACQYGKNISQNDISMIMDTVTRSSIHTAMDSIRSGFITMQGGHRIGICGLAVIKEGEVAMMRNISSISIRIAKEYRGCSDEVMEKLVSNKIFKSTVIISPPGLGKTTLLRDIVRNLSLLGIRTGIADERGEIAAMYQCIPRFDIGKTADVIDGAPKSIGMMMLLKTMSPMVLCADEITAQSDVDAIESAANCGVGLLVTVHAESIEDMKMRPVTQNLISRGIFSRAVIISRNLSKRSYTVCELDT